MQILRGLPHRGCNALIAIHAVKSAEFVADFKQQFPDRPVVIALTGTDIFQDGSTEHLLYQSLELSTRIIALQNHLASVVPEIYHHKMQVIFQSFTPPVRKPRPRGDGFTACVLGHLRSVKDPLLAARASRRLPAWSSIKILQVGGVLETGYEAQARQEMATNLRYSWLGELSRMKAIQALASCQLLVQSSLTEGGPSAVSEAISMGVPVLSTPTSGVLGVMGQEYPGYFPFTDEQALADLLLRCEENPDFLGNLRLHCHQIRPLFEPAAEQLAWSEFLAELGLPAGATG